MIDAARTSTFVISLTSFDARGDIDLEDFRAHLQRLAAVGVGVFVAGSGSGEGHALTLGEVETLLRVARAEIGGKVPLGAMGREPRTARELLEYGEVVTAAGLDLFRVNPLEPGHGVIPTEEEIEAYLVEVASSLNLRLAVASHVASGYSIPVPVLARIVERFDHVVGIHCFTRDTGYLAAVIDAVGSRAAVHVSAGDQALPALALGASGYLTSDGNLAPRLSVSVTDLHNAGDSARRDQAAATVVRLQKATAAVGAIRFVKAALTQLGLPGGYPRNPRLPVEPAELTWIVKTVEELGLAAIEGWPT